MESTSSSQMIAFLLSGKHTTGQLVETILQVSLVTKQIIIHYYIKSISLMLYLGHGDGVSPLTEFLLQLSSEFFHHVRARKTCDLLEIHCLHNTQKSS